MSDFNRSVFDSASKPKCSEAYPYSLTHCYVDTILRITAIGYLSNKFFGIVHAFSSSKFKISFIKTDAFSDQNECINVVRFKLSFGRAFSCFLTSQATLFPTYFASVKLGKINKIQLRKCYGTASIRVPIPASLS